MGGRALLDLSGGAFTRATEGSYLTGAPNADGGFMSWAAANVRRYEDRGDGAGSLLLLEAARNCRLVRTTNLLDAAWADFPLASQAVTVDANLGPDGNGCWRIQAPDASRFYQIASLTPPTTSVWIRARSGTAIVNLSAEHVGTATFDAVGTTVGETWTRLFLAGPVGQNRGTQSIVDQNDRTAVGGVDASEASDVLIALPSDDGPSPRFPDSTFRNSTGSSLIRTADTLTFVSGAYPSWLLSGRGEFSQVSMNAALDGTDIALNGAWWLLSFGTGNDGVRIRQDVGVSYVEVLSGGVVVAQSQSLATARHALQGAVSWDPAAGRVYVNGAAGPAGTPWTWPAGQALRVGGIVGGTSELNGRVGQLRAW